MYTLEDQEQQMSSTNLKGLVDNALSDATAACHALHLRRIIEPPALATAAAFGKHRSPA